MTSDTGWNLADVWEAVAEIVPARPAQRWGSHQSTWMEFDRRANALAADFLRAGLSHQSKVAAYLYNCPEYLETYYAALKVSAAPLNTNYRYGPDEVAYLLGNADAEAVVFHATFAPVLAEILDRLPLVKRWYVVEDGSPLPAWATPYEDAVGPGSDRVGAPRAGGGGGRGARPRRRPVGAVR
jgi:acyl-CoA synthetase (AMP-forming)/AMP-acid ligase II